MGNSESIRMDEEHKEKKYLMEDVISLRQRITELEKIEAMSEQATNELRISEEKFFKAFTANPSLMAIRSLKDGRYLDVNDAYSRVTGFHKEELIGKVSTEMGIVDPETMGKAKQMVDNQGFMRNWEITFKTKSGEIRTGLFSAVIIQIENEPCILSAVMDITERKRVEEALIRTEGKYRSIFENAVMGIFQATPEGRIISANPAFARILGYDSPEEVLNTITDMARQLYVHPEHRADLLREMDQQGTIQGQEIQFFRRDGSIASIIVNGRTVCDDTGRLLYYEGAIQDITDRKLLESQLRQAHKMEAIGTLAGGIAHDFNNILSAIMGYTDMALTNSKLDDRLRHYLSQVYKSGERARDLVKQILTFSRHNDEKPRPMRISPTVKEVLALLRASLPSTIKIRQEVQSEPDTVFADPTHIHQILMNLCTNAAHAMRGKKGELKVRLLPMEIKPRDMLIVRHGLTPGMYLQLTVSDTGVGIAPEIMDRIFDPFFTTKKPGEGTGMGLSVVHGIVKNYGGAITAESDIGRGAEFNVYLPLLMAPGEGRDVETAFHMPEGKERILFVDDEENLVHLGKDVLARLGYEVVGRTSSLDALELFRSRPERFDLVITDMTMPNITGSELAQEIMRIRPDMPVILCTGFSEAITPEKAKAMGVKEFIMKPLSQRQLAAAIRCVLDQRA